MATIPTLNTGLPVVPPGVVRPGRPRNRLRAARAARPPSTRLSHDVATVVRRRRWAAWLLAGILVLVAAIIGGIAFASHATASHLVAAQQTPCPCPAGSYCTTSGTASHHAAACVQCNEDSECAAGNRCQHNACVKSCSTDGDCPSAAGHCLNGGCVACTGDADCAGNAETKTCMGGKCVACVEDSQCNAGESCDRKTQTCVAGCGAAGECEAPLLCDPTLLRCVECVADSDCSGATPVCSVGGRCVQCVSDAQCVAALASPSAACNALTNTCVAEECAALDLSGTLVAPFQLRRATTAASDDPQCLTSVAECPDGTTAVVGTRCAQWQSCSPGNGAQHWIVETHTGDAGVTAVLRHVGNAANSAAALASAGGYLQPSLTGGSAARVTAAAPTPAHTPLALTLPSATTSPAGFLVRAADVGAGAASAATYLGVDTSGEYAAWTTSAGGASTFTAHFVTPTWQTCTAYVVGT